MSGGQRRSHRKRSRKIRLVEEDFEQSKSRIVDADDSSEAEDVDHGSRADRRGDAADGAMHPSVDLAEVAKEADEPPASMHVSLDGRWRVRMGLVVVAGGIVRSRLRTVPSDEAISELCSALIGAEENAKLQARTRRHAKARARADADATATTLFISKTDAAPPPARVSTPDGGRELDAVRRLSLDELKGFTESELRQLRLSSLRAIVQRMGIREPMGGYPTVERAARAIRDRIYRDRSIKRGPGDEVSGAGNPSSAAGHLLARSAEPTPVLRGPGESRAKPLDEASLPHLQVSLKRFVGGLPLRCVHAFEVRDPNGQGAALASLLHPRGRPPDDLESAGYVLTGQLVASDSKDATSLTPWIRTTPVREVVMASLAPPALRLRTSVGWYEAELPSEDFGRAIIAGRGASSSEPLSENRLAASGAVPWQHPIWPLVPLRTGPSAEDTAAPGTPVAKCRWCTQVSVRGEDGALTPLADVWTALRPGAKEDSRPEFTVTALLAVEPPEAPVDADNGPCEPGVAGELPKGGVWVRIDRITSPALCVRRTDGGTALVFCVRTSVGLYALLSPAPAYHEHFACPGAALLPKRAAAPPEEGDMAEEAPLVPLLERELQLDAREPPGDHWKLSTFSVAGVSTLGLFRAVRESAAAVKTGSRSSRATLVGMLELKAAGGVVLLRVRVPDVERVSVDYGDALFGDAPKPVDPRVFVRTGKGRVYELARAADGFKGYLPEAACIGVVYAMVCMFHDYDAKVRSGRTAAPPVAPMNRSPHPSLAGAVCLCALPVVQGASTWPAEARPHRQGGPLPPCCQGIQDVYFQVHVEGGQGRGAYGTEHRPDGAVDRRRAPQAQTSAGRFYGPERCASALWSATACLGKAPNHHAGDGPLCSAGAGGHRSRCSGVRGRGAELPHAQSIRRSSCQARRASPGSRPGAQREACW